MAEVTRLDEDHVGIILSNEEASIYYRLLGHHVGASIERNIRTWHGLRDIGVIECPEEFSGLVSRG